MVKFRWETEFKKTEIGEMPKEWEVKRIKEIGEIAGGTTPSTKIKEFWDGNVAWLTPKDLRDYEYIYISKGERNITQKAVEEVSLKIFPKGTVLLTTRAPIGYVAIAKNPITTNQGFRNIIPYKIKSEYLYYYLKRVTDYLKSLAGGSTFGELTGNTLKEVLVPYPPPTEQSRIATVLSWFDDLIENKKRQNEILEKTAMAIFKSWFVDFEPFKDEEFIYNADLDREVPKGWKIETLKGLTKNIISGRGQYIIKAKEGKYPLWGANGILGFIDKYDLEGFAILTGRVGTLGKVFLVNDKFSISDNVLTLIPKETIHIFFIYLWVKTQINFEALNVGSTQPLLTKTALGDKKVILPPQPILEKFHSIVEPLFQKIVLNQKQIMVLRKIRDALLPQLVFGKLRVVEL